MAKSIKVYKVRTGCLEIKDDIQGYDNYTITARDAKEAIYKVEKTFNFDKGEYIVSMDVIATLD